MEPRLANQISSPRRARTVQPTCTNASVSRSAAARASSTLASEQTSMAIGGGSAKRGICTSAQAVGESGTRGDAVRASPMALSDAKAMTSSAWSLVIGMSTTMVTTKAAFAVSRNSGLTA
jgi:hypothetical protein